MYLVALIQTFNSIEMYKNRQIISVKLKMFTSGETKELTEWSFYSVCHHDLSQFEAILVFILTLQPY